MEENDKIENEKTKEYWKEFLDDFEEPITWFLFIIATICGAIFFVLLTDGESGAWIAFLISIPLYYLCWAFLNRKSQAEEIQAKKDEEKYFNNLSTLQNIKEISPIKFEKLVGRMFRDMGYEVQETSKTGDGGVDLYLYKDNAKEIVQCKRYKGSVSVTTVREFYGVMIDEKAKRGYVVTTGTFTLPASQFAEGKGLHLVDGPELVEMLSQIDNQ